MGEAHPRRLAPSVRLATIRLRRSFGTLVFPTPCCLCDGALPDPLGSPICPECRAGLVAFGEPACPKCGRFLPSAASGRCDGCRRRRPPYRRAVAAARHEGVFRRALLELKFHRREALAAFLAPPALAAYRRAGHEIPPRAVVAMPLPFWRGRRRGCNQAELLAIPIARGLGLPLLTGILRRRARPPQTSVSRSARRANVRGAFRARRLPPDLAGRPLLLVDDVFTTGSTAEAAARALLRAGSGPVDVLTATRADGPDGRTPLRVDPARLQRDRGRPGATRRDPADQRGIADLIPGAKSGRLHHRSGASPAPRTERQKS